MNDDLYEVWRIQNVDNRGGRNPVIHICKEFKTAHVIEARTQKEAEYKLHRKFKNAGFHLMGLFVRKANALTEAEDARSSE